MPKVKRYILTVKCIVMKSVTVLAESEEEARKNPWDGAEDEYETDQIDWEIISIKEDK